jgi:hypothetical protein
MLSLQYHNADPGKGRFPTPKGKRYRACIGPMGAGPGGGPSAAPLPALPLAAGGNRANLDPHMIRAAFISVPVLPKRSGAGAPAQGSGGWVQPPAWKWSRCTRFASLGKVMADGPCRDPSSGVSAGSGWLARDVAFRLP